MFKYCLDTKGNTAALCYLPTRFATIVEFYHTEVPAAYRHLGIGDLLVQKAFEWAEQSNLLVIPTCIFVKRYLNTHYPDGNDGYWKMIVNSEQLGYEKLVEKN
ncbi:GCN5-related N-acetyl-transferase-domain-containing protein [Cunninghamella echinulata]|nr:GCN5-related N-acetyl-transferase-domain-containing protein [Cunninghamella echinulata]